MKGLLMMLALGETAPRHHKKRTVNKRTHIGIDAAFAND